MNECVFMKLESMEILCIRSSLMFHQRNENHHDFCRWKAISSLVLLCLALPYATLNFSRKIKCHEKLKWWPIFCFFLSTFDNNHHHHCWGRAFFSKWRFRNSGCWLLERHGIEISFCARSIIIIILLCTSICTHTALFSFSFSCRSNVAHFFLSSCSFASFPF